jgi:hypothetical protein
MPATVRACAVGLFVVLAYGNPLAIAAHSVGRTADDRDVPARVVPPCTMTLDVDEDEIDGATLSEAVPGAVICLPTAIRGNLKVANLQGAPEAPITIRNEGGPVVITGARYEAGILIQSSRHVRITGSGETSQCGATFASDAQRCGIVIDGANKGIVVATKRGDVAELEIDHVAINRTSTEQDTRGIAIHPVPGQVIEGVHIHHNHVRRTGAEAIYLGSEPRSDTVSELGQMRRVTVAYNRVEEIAWDGIKVKVALSDSEIHHNVVRDTGRARYERHQSGITVAMSDIAVHHNVVVGAPEGIKTGRPLEGASNRFHDNLVVDVDHFGIETSEPGAVISHNTIVGSADVGIRARGEGSAISENVVVDAVEPLVERRHSQFVNNFIGDAAEARFVAPDAGNFSLKPSSPAASAGSVRSVTTCVSPGFKTLRPPSFSVALGSHDPARCRADLGIDGSVARLLSRGA